MMAEGATRRNLMIKDEAWQVLEDHGITVRKRGEKISEIIMEKYTPISVEKLLEPIPTIILEEHIKQRREKDSSVEVK